jgi:hypothetical protein
MTVIMKVLANTIPIGTANNTVGSARLLRIVNIDTVAALVTVFDTAANTQISTIPVMPNGEVYLTKKKTDAITSNNATLTLATQVATTG